MTLNTDWLEPDFFPATMTDSPFPELPHEPRWAEVWRARDTLDHRPTTMSLEAYAAELVAAVDAQLARIDAPVVCLLSGGYDSRLLAALLERAGCEPLYWGDGTEEPEWSNTLDLLDVPAERRRVWNMDVADPYGVSSAEVDGFAPLYYGMRFFDSDPAATLVTGFMGNAWFSYPAQNWTRGKPRRIEHNTLVDMWIDTIPHYWVLPDAWERGFGAAVHPFTTVEYARVVAKCNPDWLKIVPGYPGDLDMVRKAMLDHVDGRLAGLGWKPHDYRWNLTPEQAVLMDARFAGSWLAQTFGLDARPSLLDAAYHDCKLGGFAGWCDRLIAAGHTLQ